MTCPPHHIVYERPDGPTSKGECKYCGEQFEHANSQPDGFKRLRLSGSRKGPPPNKTGAGSRGSNWGWQEFRKGKTE